MKKKIGFIQTLLALSLVPLVVIVAVSVAFSASTLKAQMEEDTAEKLYIAAESVEEYFAYDIISNGDVSYDEYADHEFIDTLKSQDIELTLFKGDTRFLTSIKNEDGSRNEGTQASPEIWAKVQSGETYSAENVKIGDREFFVYYIPVYADEAQTSVWGMAFAGLPEDDLETMTSKTVASMVTLSIILAGIAAAIVVFIALKVKKSLQDAVDSLEVLAGGNISAAIDVESPITELNAIADASRLLQKNLNDAISGVKETAIALSSVVSEVSGLCEQNSTSSVQVDEAVQELAKATESMAQSVESTNTETITMGNDIENIVSRVYDMSNSSDSIKSANKDASDYIDSVYASSNRSVAAVEAISNQINATNAAIRKVNDVVATIMEISSQTNLLALNASIEAARAGEAGRGFAVVADEIGKLAQQSADGASQISELAENMISMSMESVAHAEQITEIIVKEQESVKNAQQKFGVLASGVDESVEGISDISGKTDSLAIIKDQITNNISDLSSISEENGAMAQQISASITQMSEAITTTMSKAQEMQAMSEHLNSLVEYFK